MRSTLRDVRTLLAKATPGRVWNATQVVASYVLSRLTGRARAWGLPLALAFEPTTSCNLRCPECPSGLRSFTRPTGMLAPTLFRQTLDELGSRLWYLIFYFQGEPYLHPEFLDLVAYASRKGVYTATSTNAHFLSDANARRTVESGLDRLIISLDGTTQEVYEQYRIGGKLQKVLEGTRNVVRWRKALNKRTPRIIFQFLVVRPNEHQLADAQALAQALGVDDVWFKTAQIYDYQHGSPLIPTIDYYSRYANNGNGTYRLKNKLVNGCWKMWHSCVVTWDGKVVPCCFDKDAAYRLGDASHTSFGQLWRGAKYQGFRQALLRGRDQVEMCRNCTEGTKVWG